MTPAFKQERDKGLKKEKTGLAGANEKGRSLL